MDFPVPTGPGPSTPRPSSDPSSTSVLSRFVEAFVEHVLGWGWVMLLVGLAPGLAVWPLRHHEELGYVVRSDVNQEFRYELLTSMATSLALVLSLYVAAYAWLSRTNPKLGFAAAATQL